MVRSMSNAAPRGPDPRLTDDRMVTPERSVFGTRLPRPTGVGRHLIVVIAFALIALAVAIAFAERDTGGAEAPAAVGDSAK
jgi:hypothetical protein